MSKNLLQDMVKVKQTREEAQTQKIVEREVKKHNKGGSRYMLWFMAIIPVAFFLFALSYLFSKAVVTVNSKTQDVVLNENLSASLDESTDNLPFNLVVISGEENKTVQAAGVKDISQNAEGIVVIYNSFSSATQRLNIDTRLEGSNGKIYKTKKAIVVPGMKGNTPGSIEVGIYGSAPGVEYNSAPLDFKIFGFKGTPKYSKFYGRSKGEITGGFKGKAPDISATEQTAAINDLKTVLQAKLLKKATEQIPAGFILFKDAVFFNTGDNNIDLTLSKDNTLPIDLKGTLYGLLFDEQKLSKKIAQDNVDKYDGSDVSIPNIRDLTFSLSNAGNISFADIKNINFNLSGAVKIVWNLDVGKLTNDLLGKSKKDFSQILSRYPNINSADLVLSPVWTMSIPNRPKDIKIIVNDAK